MDLAKVTLGVSKFGDSACLAMIMRATSGLCGLCRLLKSTLGNHNTHKSTRLFGATQGPKVPGPPPTFPGEGPRWGGCR
jgi:hypothetical protein